MPCQDKAMPLKAARGDRKLRANGCWETLWSEERSVASLTATPRSGVRSGAVRTPVVLGTIFKLFQLLHSGMLILECTLVLLLLQ